MQCTHRSPPPKWGGLLLACLSVCCVIHGASRLQSAACQQPLLLCFVASLLRCFVACLLEVRSFLLELLELLLLLLLLLGTRCCCCCCCCCSCTLTDAVLVLTKSNPTIRVR